MDVIEKLEEFLKTKDEEYLLSLKKHFFERLQISSNDKGELTGIKPSEIDELLTIDYIIECLVEIPNGLADFLYLVEEFIEPISDILLHFITIYFVNKLDKSTFEELKEELDAGSNEALIVLFNSAFAKLKKIDASLDYESIQMFQNILVNLNGKILKLLMQAFLSIHLGLHGSAKMQIQHALKLLLKKLTPYDFQHSIVGKSAIKKKAKDSAKKGSVKRWELERKIKEEALKMLEEMKEAGKFKNYSQASKQLTDKICQFAQKEGSPFTDSFSAQRRIYDWFRSS